MAETGSAEPRRTVVTMPKEPLQITPFDSVLEKIKQWVDNTEPDSVRRSGDYYLAARDLLEEAARELAERPRTWPTTTGERRARRRRNSCSSCTRPFANSPPRWG